MKKSFMLLSLLLLLSFRLSAQNYEAVCKNIAATIAANIGMNIAMGQSENSYLNLPNIAAINAKLQSPITLPAGYTALTDNVYRVKVSHTASGVFSYVAFGGSSSVSTMEKSAVMCINSYPNPFNPETTISYNLANSGIVMLAIYNNLGNKVAVLKNEQQSTGRHSVIFNGANLPSGIYYSVLKVDNAAILSHKLLLIK